MNSQLKFEINDLRQQNIQHLLESVGVIMTALIVASLLPTLLLQFVYTDQAALMGGQTPFWLQNGSMIIFGIGVLYFVFVAVTTFTRSRKITMLKQQMSMVGADVALSSVEVIAQEKELAALEKMVDAALQDGKKTVKSPRRGRGRPAKK
ncbi:hypothetical protein KA012_02590 [Candidatus Woesebacteria bacterium]|nr:hypothetical protein [Candidatus Woesebacteria bacterium]